MRTVRTSMQLPRIASSWLALFGWIVTRTGLAERALEYAFTNNVSMRKSQGSPGFAEREIWNIRSDQSALMLAARTTLAHFSVSSVISLPKSAGVPASAVPPTSASCALNLGLARAALISLLSLSIISTGVFLGVPMPWQRACLIARHKIGYG